MSQRMMVGEFTFDAASGELQCAGPDGTREVRRLAPQPARLLSLLVAHRGQVVTHSVLREALWPDSRVEFDQGLHFCIRQVRAALGDSAADPRYVQTIPRRGYRLVAKVEVLADGPPQEAGAGRGRMQRRIGVVAGAAIVLLAVAVVWLVAGRAGSQPDRLRLAVLPFRPPAGITAPPSHGRIADSVLLRAARAEDRRLELVGPTTTGAYADDAASIRRLIADLGVDYLLHGRYLDEPGGPRLYAELIRASDGVHVWVHEFDVQQDADAIARLAAEAIGELLRRPGPEA